MYKLFVDRPVDFICEIAVKNASLKNSLARIIVESKDISLLFKGEIKNGKCIVPIHRLKGLLDENITGHILLEIIVEDTHFVPWRDEFTVEENTSVKVKVEEQKKSVKPTIEVRPIREQSVSVPVQQILFICEKVGITKDNIINKKSDLKQVIKEYFKASPEFIKESKKYIQEAVMALK